MRGAERISQKAVGREDSIRLGKDARETGSELLRGVQCGRVDAMDQLSRTVLTHTTFRLFQGD